MSDISTPRPRALIRENTVYLPFSTLAYYVWNYPLKCAPAQTEAHFSGYTNDDRTML